MSKAKRVELSAKDRLALNEWRKVAAKRERRIIEKVTPYPVSANRWIVVAQNYKEHTSLETAMTEMQRLQEQLPKLRFRLYRILEREAMGDLIETITLKGDGVER